MYDICIISFSSLEYDARSLNAIVSLSKKWSVACISLTPESKINSLNLGNAAHFSIEVKGKRHITRWREFSKKIKQIGALQSKILWAADLYSLLPCIYLKKQSGGKVLYDSREIYSALGTLHGSSVKQFAITNIEKYLVRKVEHFIVSGELDAEYLKQHFRTSKPFSVFLNVPPYRERLDSSKILQAYPNLKGKEILIYQGAVLDGRGIIPALNFISEFDEYALVVIGDGEFLARAKHFAHSKGLDDRAVFVGAVLYGELHDWTCSADYGINLIEPLSFSYKLALPNKMFEYIMAGVPQIISDLPAMRKIVENYGIGEIVEDLSSAKSIKNSIEKLKSKKAFYVENCLLAAKVFNYEAEEAKIHQLIDSLIK